MFPNGLANGSGLVGRNLMLHPYARVEGQFPDPLGFFVPDEIAGIVSFAFQKTIPERGFLRGSKLQVNAGPGPLDIATGKITKKPLPWGNSHHKEFEKQFDHFCGITICAEDLPEYKNCINLSKKIKDKDNLPVAKINYKVSKNSRRILDFGIKRAEELLKEAGAIRTYSNPLLSQAGFHLMGTARMGKDPKSSVVDPQGRCHEIDNLFIADSSVFVTSSVSNPTATAQALALRSAEIVCKQLD